MNEAKSLNDTKKMFLSLTRCETMKNEKLTRNDRLKNEKKNTEKVRIYESKIIENENANAFQKIARNEEKDII